MPSRRFELTIPEELLERLDADRGHEPRASFVKRAVELALDLWNTDPSVDRIARIRATWDSLSPEDREKLNPAPPAAPKAKPASAPPVKAKAAKLAAARAAVATAPGMRVAECGCAVPESSSLKRCLPHGRPFR